MKENNKKFGWFKTKLIKFENLDTMITKITVYTKS